MADVACAAGFGAPAGAAVIGLAGTGAALWPNADPAASKVATVTIVMVRMLDAPGMRRAGADVEIDKFVRSSETIWIGF